MISCNFQRTILALNFNASASAYSHIYLGVILMLKLVFKFIVVNVVASIRGARRFDAVWGFYPSDKSNIASALARVPRYINLHCLVIKRAWVRCREIVYAIAGVIVIFMVIVIAFAVAVFITIGAGAVRGVVAPRDIRAERV